MGKRMVYFLIFLVSVFLATGKVWAADVFQFKDTRLGTISVGTLDWLPGNALAVGAVPLAVSPESSNFNLLMQTALGSFIDANSNVIPLSGLGVDYEITIVMGATHQGSLASAAGSPYSTSYQLNPNGPLNFFKMYYDTSKNSNTLKGTGFNDGILIMSGTVSNAFGNYSLSNLTSANLDGFLTNNYSGVTTLKGIGGYSSVVNIDYYNPSYISFSIPNPSITFDTSTNEVTPFVQADPAAAFFNGSGVQTPVRGAGKVNGLPAASGQADFQFQIDPNSAVQVACSGTIGDYIWHDLNRNGIQDAGEPGIDGVVVNLYDNSNNLLDTITTGTGPGGQHGFYQFTNVCTGTYQVIVDASTLPPGYTPTLNTVGTDRSVDSNGSPATVTLDATKLSDNTIDFGYVSPCTGTVGDFVWNDLNRNGVQDANEPGIDNVPVSIYLGSTLIGTTNTSVGPGNQHGYYQFTGLCAGSYTVQATTPAGFVPSTSFLGGDTTKDSNGSPASVTLSTDNSVDTTIDFGFNAPCSGTVGDFVWNDLNRNGIQDANEPGIDGATVRIFDAANNQVGLTTTGFDSVTQLHGKYQFSGLCAGTYTVKVTTPVGFVASSSLVGTDTTIDSNGSPASVTLPDDFSSDMTIDFGYNTPCTGSLGDFVWNDLNEDGIQNSGEPGIGGVSIVLRNALDNSFIASTTTDANGAYTFNSLCKGDYKIEVTAPAGFVPSPSNAPLSTTANDSNGSPTIATLPADNTVDTTYDFGYYIVPVSSTCVGITAVQGVAITPVTMTGSGGVGGPFTFSAIGLPAGITMSTDGTISGTPSVSGTFSYTVTITDKSGNTGTSNCSVTVNPPVSATCVGITAVQGVAITPVTMIGVGGTGAPYTFSATGLPAGIIMSIDGTISGTPTVSGTFNYTVTVTDKSGNTGTSNCSVTVNPPVSATCVGITAVQGVAITPVTMIGVGGTGAPYTFSATGLPAGISMSIGGTISGTPSVSGTFSYTVTVTDKSGNTGTSNCSVTVNPPVSATCVGITAVEGVAITPVTMTGVGGAGAPYTFSATGLPAGISMSIGGTISGTPSVSGTFNYTVTITDKSGNTGTSNCSVTVNPPVSATCVGITAVQGVAITPVTMIGIGGAGAPYTFSATGLPAGISMSIGGTISGTPSVSGTFSYTVTITDKSGNTGTSNCSVTVNPPVSATCVGITAVQGVAITPVTMIGVGGAGAPYTFSATGLPAGISMSIGGTISGTPTVSGTFNYTVTVTDKSGNTGTSNCSVTVNPPVSATCVGITAVQGVAITPVTMIGVGGAGAPYTFSATGLPAGITMSIGGTISGTPSVSGTFNYTVTITDKSGNTGTSNCSVTVSCTGSISGHVLRDCDANGIGESGLAGITVTLKDSGGHVVATTLTAADGLYQFNNLPAGSYTVVVGISAIDYKQTLDPDTVKDSQTVVTLASGQNVVGKDFAYTGMKPGITLTQTADKSTANCGETITYTFVVTDTGNTCFYGGVTVDDALLGGQIFHQTPVSPGQTITFTKTYVAKATDPSPLASTATATGHVPTGIGLTDVTATAAVSTVLKCSAVSTTCIGITAVRGLAITPVTMIGIGGTGAPYTFSATGLPTGITISTSGTISGTPTVSGTFSYTVTVKDAAGNIGTSNCSVTVTAPITGCTYTLGYWKTHCNWPVTSLTLGQKSYNQADLTTILKSSVSGNGLISLAHQLIAAKLNIANGASTTPEVASNLAAADALIGSLVVPPIGSGYLAPGLTSSFESVLDTYNNGLASGGPAHCGDGCPIPPPVQICTGSIGDFVWNDGNANGLQDGSPSIGIPGVKVTLYNVATGITTSTTTDSNGKYLFSGLCASNYTVTAATPSGWKLSPSFQGTDRTKDSNGSPASVTLATNSSSDLTIDFGFYPSAVTTCTGSIGNLVWNDLDRDGIQDTGEPGIPGVAVTLTGNSKTITTTTDVNGNYQFTGLCAGTYTVTVSTPCTYSPSPTAQGGDTAKDSNGSPIATVTLGSNSTSNQTIDFGFFKSPTTSQGSGCSPGYWKNHNTNWPTAYRTSDCFDTVFGTSACSLSLNNCMSQGGGGLIALTRQAAAALLNAADPRINYPLTVDQIKAAVRNAIARGQYADLTNLLDHYNNLGCPF